MSDGRDWSVPESVPGADRIDEWYHLPVLLVLLAFMFWTRTHQWQRFLRDGTVYFSGNDAWYHLRMVVYTVHNWPATMPYDPWTHFPVGTSVGQFGTLFDQLVATAALVVGLGSPTHQQIALTLLFAPAVFGTLVVFPAYVIGRRMGGKFAGLLGVLVLALTPGSFLRRGVVGFADHHVAETLFMGLTMLSLMVAVSVAEDEKPIYELFRARDWDAVRRPVIWSVLTGVTFALYLWTWPPGIFLAAVLGGFFAIKLAADYLRGTSPDHVATVGVISMATVGVLSLLTIQQPTMASTRLTLLQPFLAFAVAAGCAFMAGLARQWNARSLPRYNYPVAVVGVGVVLLGLMALLLPGTFDYMVSQFLRVFGYDVAAAARTVGEAQPIPLSRAAGFFVSSFGLAYFAAAVGGAIGVWKVAKGRERGQVLLVVVWLVFMTAATFTQRRFEYYLVLPVTALTAYLAGYVLEVIDLRAASRIREIEAYQVMTVFAILLVVTGPFVVFSGPTLASVQSADRASNPGSVTNWDPTLRWMANETPEPGTYGGGGEPMQYYGSYEHTDDFEYPDGAYGVMAWWDYGHWITTRGERIPNANPFQQGANNAADYLLAANETTANDRITYSNGTEQTRYVMIDWMLAVPFSTKYTAPTAFYEQGELSSNDLVTPLYTRTEQGARLGMVARTQRHYDSMRVRLYHFHGSSAEPAPVVVDYEQPNVTADGDINYAFTPQNRPAVRVFDNMSAARQYVERDGSARIGGIGRFPSERVPALKHYRLVKQSESSALSSSRYLQIYRGEAQRLAQTLYNTQRPNRNQTDRAYRLLTETRHSWVKSFERVPGATVEGTGPANANVTVSVQLFVPSTKSTFTYRQRVQTGPDGEFTTTLPYSTTGYEKWGTEEGYTNVSVKAVGPYRFSTSPRTNESLYTTRWTGSSHVTEGQVIGENETTVTVNMEKEVLDAPEGAQTGNETSTNTTSSLRGPSEFDTFAADATRA